MCSFRSIYDLRQRVKIHTVRHVRAPSAKDSSASRAEQRQRELELLLCCCRVPVSCACGPVGRRALLSAARRAARFSAILINVQTRTRARWINKLIRFVILRVLTSYAENSTLQSTTPIVDCSLLFTTLYSTLNLQQHEDS